MDDLDPKLVARLRRTILRIVQTEGPITRTALSVQVRPHSEHWVDILDDLIDRGLIQREAVIKANGRAAVSYHLSNKPLSADDAELDFTEMLPEEVSDFVVGFPIIEQATAVNA